MHLSSLSVYDDEASIMRLRINFLHMDGTIQVPTVQQRLLNTFKFFGQRPGSFRQYCEFITANFTGGPVFKEAARLIAWAGWRLGAHLLSSTEFQTRIQGSEAINAEHSIKVFRWAVAHMPLTAAEFLDRLKKWGGVRICQDGSTWLGLDGGLDPLSKTSWQAAYRRE
ncbi:Uu.00g079330.m01.CDS01 [Anthostomella pinea]|uniref:Uu.00g079330.m01.CDS01 n=1 Tax=Anthostomella pinea TaxID=933095 RepID=A0AAI8VLG3_9PEZI|nr:Uu.00g079330.m01.CDS01 [Anthostomella pinea]